MKKKIINMEKKLLEEIKQFKLLTDYNTKKTLTENKVLIIENIGGEIEALIKAFKSTNSFRTEILTFLSRGVKDESDNLIRNVDDLEHAISIGHVSQQTMKDLKTFLVNTSNIPEVVKELIENAVKSTDFILKYSKLTAKEASTELAKKGYTPEAIRKITQAFKDSGRNFKIIEDVLENVLNSIKQDSKAVTIYNNLSAVDVKSFKDYITANIHSGKEYDDVLDIAESWISKKGFSQFLQKWGRRIKKLLSTKNIMIGAGILTLWAAWNNKIQILDLLEKALNMTYDETKGKTTPDNSSSGKKEERIPFGFDADTGKPIYQN